MLPSGNPCVRTRSSCPGLRRRRAQSRASARFRYFRRETRRLKFQAEKAYGARDRPSPIGLTFRPAMMQGRCRLALIREPAGCQPEDNPADGTRTNSPTFSLYTISMVSKEFSRLGYSCVLAATQRTCPPRSVQRRVSAGGDGPGASAMSPATSSACSAPTSKTSQPEGTTRRAPATISR